MRRISPPFLTAVSCSEILNRRKRFRSSLDRRRSSCLRRHIKFELTTLPGAPGFTVFPRSYNRSLRLHLQIVTARVSRRVKKASMMLRGGKAKDEVSQVFCLIARHYVSSMGTGPFAESERKRYYSPFKQSSGSRQAGSIKRSPLVWDRVNAVAHLT